MKRTYRAIFWNEKYGEKHDELMCMIENPCDARRLSYEPFDVFGKEYKGPKKLTVERIYLESGIHVFSLTLTNVTFSMRFVFKAQER